MASAFCVAESDNVATLLEDVSTGVVDVIGSAGIQSVAAVSPIQAGHKVALCDIRAGEPIVKYSVPIGLAKSDIRAGEWVHLHNCRSRLDERSSTLDAHTGAPTDTRYA